jgi:hypothetical protein
MGIPVPNYEDYLVYPDGSVFSLKTNKFMKHNTTERGYKSVELFNKHGSKRLCVHRLVAQAYIPNPDNLPQVNHKDENPSNNNVDNLEWCTAKYNMNYGNGAKTRYLKIDYSTPERKALAIKNGKMACKPVLQLSMQGEVIARYESARAAKAAIGDRYTHITDCCKGKRKSSKGYMWKYERSDDLSQSQS